MRIIGIPSIHWVSINIHVMRMLRIFWREFVDVMMFCRTERRHMAPNGGNANFRWMFLILVASEPKFILGLHPSTELLFPLPFMRVRSTYYNIPVYIHACEKKPPLGRLRLYDEFATVDSTEFALNFLCQRRFVPYPSVRHPD